MNKFSGHITAIEVSGSLSLVSISINNKVEIKSIVIETPETASYLKIGNEVNILFKETEVVIGTNTKHAISLQNRIAGVIEDVVRGKLISSIRIRSDVGTLESVISTNAVNTLQLKVGSEVVAMVKLNEIMLSP